MLVLLILPNRFPKVIVPEHSAKKPQVVLLPPVLKSALVFSLPSALDVSTVGYFHCRMKGKRMYAASHGTPLPTSKCSDMHIGPPAQRFYEVISAMVSGFPSLLRKASFNVNVNK